MLEKLKIRYYIASLRLERWPRSLAIFPGLVMAVMLAEAGAPPMEPGMLLLRSGGAFLLTWMISTVNYIINEITDAPYDAFHPAKKNRPLVTKQIRRRFLVLFGLIWAAVSFYCAICFYSRAFSYALFALLVAGVLYNVKPVRIKDIPYLDSTLESANNPIRFLIGWYVISKSAAPISLLISWWAFGNFLMVGKRVAEKKFLSSEESSGYRKSLRRYSVSGLVVFMSLTGLVFLITFVLFALRLKLLLLVYSLPLIIFYLSFFFYKSIQDRDTAEEPERLLKNPYFAAYTFILMILFVLAFWLR